GSDAVRPHHDRPLGAVLVQNARTKSLRILGAELEDVSDLDRGPELQRAAAHRTPVTFFGDAKICKPGVKVSAVLDTLQVPARPVGARHELTPAKRLVGDDLALEPDGAERPWI